MGTENRSRFQRFGRNDLIPMVRRWPADRFGEAVARSECETPRNAADILRETRRMGRNSEDIGPSHGLKHLCFQCV
jgi:plasmid stabilization system protein ParE